MNLSEWTPIAIFMVISLVMPLGMIGLGIAFGSKQRRPDIRGQKHIAFESGVSVGNSERQRFPIDFYLTAMLFIVFDIEMVFMFPLAAIIQKLGTFGLIELGVFVTILLAAYFYVWGRGALDWE